MSSRNVIGAVCVAVLASALASASVGAAQSPSRDGPTTSSSASSSGAGGTAAVIKLAGEVDDYNRDALFRRFDKARRIGARTVILEIDTYGGLVTSGLDISRFVKNQKDLHTIAFVNSKAISAGAMIAMACDEIVMTPSGTLGDCAPIIISRSGGGYETVGGTERAKMESPILADFQESARRNGYDPLLARAMVTLKPAVHWIEDDAGKRQFVDEPEFLTLTASHKWHIVPGVADPIDSTETLLTVGSEVAHKIGLSKGEASSAQDLASQRGCTIAAVYAPSAGDDLVTLLSSAAVRGILLSIFLTTLYVSLSSPGHGAAEATALISLGLLVGVPLLTGYAHWWEVAIVFAGLGLVAFEIFVFPGHLVSLVVGSVMVVGGLVLTFVGDAWSVPGSWEMPDTWKSLERGLFVVVGAMFCSMLLSAWLRRNMEYLPIFNRLILRPPAPAGVAAAAPSPLPGPPTGPFVGGGVETDQWPFVGTIGRSVSELKPGGSVEFPYGDDTRIAAVISEGGFVEPGSKVVVKEVRGNRVIVRSVPRTA